MATRLKTVEYWFPHLATLADAVDTDFSQITIYLPEDSKVFKSVMAEVIVADQQTAATNIARRQLTLTLQGASDYVINNTNALSNSGENIVHQFSINATSYFAANWSGTSMTLDASLLLDTSAVGSANASLRIYLTYEYDDTSASQIKTVMIPLDAPRIALGTSKPGTATDTIPALDTYCPEASKTFRQISLVVQGNQESVGTVDMSISMQVDTDTALTSVAYEKGLNSASWYRINNVVTFDTSVTHGFYLWASATDFDHPQCYMVVTYEFNPATTTRVLNSLMLPMEFGGAMGGPTVNDYQRGEREIMIEEPGTITLERSATLVFWDQLSPMTGLNFRNPNGANSWLAYTSVATTVCGGLGCMVRDDAITLARGRNTLKLDVYNTDAADLGYNLASVWMINYTSDKHTDGVGAHNHTVVWNLRTVSNLAASVQSITSVTALSVPEGNHFKTSIGLNYVYTSNTSGNPAGVHVGVERLAAEGGIIWENVYEALGGTDAEVGTRQAWATARSVFRRWKAGTVIDADESRLSVETARRWRVALGGSCNSFDTLDIYLTYHTITKTISGTISGSGGGTVTLKLCRAATGEVVMVTTRTGNGAYSFTWFDDTEEMYVDAYEDGTHLGRSDIGLAA